MRWDNRAAELAAAVNARRLFLKTPRSACLRNMACMFACASAHCVSGHSQCAARGSMDEVSNAVAGSRHRPCDWEGPLAMDVSMDQNGCPPKQPLYSLPGPSSRRKCTSVRAMHERACPLIRPVDVPHAPPTPQTFCVINHPLDHVDKQAELTEYDK